MLSLTVGGAVCVPFAHSSHVMANPEVQRNLNTILLTATIALLAFIANASVENGKDIASIKASQLTRGEVEMKLEAIRKDYADILTRIVALEKNQPHRP